MPAGALTPGTYQIVGESIIHSEALIINQTAWHKPREADPKWLFSFLVGTVQPPYLSGKPTYFLPSDKKHLLAAVSQ